MSENEVEEYKRSTLTGANVPYNPKDPRQEPRDANKIEPREGTFAFISTKCFRMLHKEYCSSLVENMYSLHLCSCLLSHSNK